MKNAKRFFSVLLALCLLTAGIALADSLPEVRVASMKGPTSMGMVKLMIDNEAGTTGQTYAFTVEGSPDAIVPQLAQGKLDIALVPCNLASILYNNTGKVQVAAVNTLGVLEILEVGDSIQSLADLQGKTIVSTGKGTTPEYGLRHVLSCAGLDPDKDVTIEFKAEATEVLAAVKSGAATIAMLPQPFATAALSQVEGLRSALRLTDEWAKVSPEGALVTGVVVVAKDFAETNPEAVALFLNEYAASTAYVNENPADETIGTWIESLDIAKAAIAAKAIPQCNITCITGTQMQEAVSGYLAALASQNPQSVGGSLPDEGFYYIGTAAE